MASPSSLSEKTEVGRCCKMRLFRREETLAGRPGNLKPSAWSRGLASDVACATCSVDTSAWRKKYELLLLAAKWSLEASAEGDVERGERGEWGERGEAACTNPAPSTAEGERAMSVAACNVEAAADP